MSRLPKIGDVVLVDIKEYKGSGVVVDIGCGFGGKGLIYVRDPKGRIFTVGKENLEPDYV